MKPTNADLTNAQIRWQPLTRNAAAVGLEGWADIAASGWRSLPIIASILCLALAAGGCGSSETTTETTPEASYRYGSAVLMTENSLETVAKDLRVRCPAGWKETVDQKSAPNIVLWLVREDYAASISFTPMLMNPVLYKTLKKDGLISVAKASLSMKKNNARDSVAVVQPPELFRLNGREHAAFEYSMDRGATVIRIVIFDTGSQYMECAMLPATASITAAENLRLFETQQAVLASMQLP